MKRKLYFTSDWHVGHANCIKFDNRPYADLDEMHNHMIKTFNHWVPKHAITYFLGDMGFGPNDLLGSIIKQLNGTKILVRGNHDRKMDAMYNAGFDVVLEKAQITIGSDIVTMTHCPLKGVFREDTSGMRGCTGKEKWHGDKKHANNYSIEDFGQWHLSGHIHSSPHRKKSIKCLGRQMDVGVVANKYKPVSISNVQSWIMKTKPLIEDWRDVVGFSGYKVNGIGEVKSFKRYKEGRLVKPYKDKDGYLCVSLRLNGSSKAQKVHQIVAKAFLENPKGHLYVNHKNGHKFDNSIPNLEWIDNTSNQRHAWETGLRVSKLTIDQVSMIKKMIEIGKSDGELASLYGVDVSTINNIRNGKTWKRIK